ncbi:MAG TPA: acetyl-CoA C-acyltransferase [Longimicrobiales bacterium]|nr:acetyl-CoA C-acyltransferase [Longimicrobiales bacterium]
MSDKNDPVIVSAVRTAVGRASKGTLRETRPDDLAAACLSAALERAGDVDPATVDDVILGCAMPEGPQGLNVARLAQFLAGIPYHVPAMTLNRFCSSGLQSIAMAADRIATGQASAILAGGTESMSMVSMSGGDFSPNPALVESMPEAYISMGLTAEEVAARFQVSREDQDAFALESHLRAVAALDSEVFREEIVPVEVTRKAPGPRGRSVVETALFDTDEGPRRDTSLEALAKLKSPFKTGGSVTAGNSSQTSDGAAAVLVMSRARARAEGREVLGVLRGYQVAGVPPEIMGIGPVEAIPKLLEHCGVARDQVGLVELNEAFASQAVYCIRTLGLDPARVNVHGGAIALGHPLGATGAKLTATLLHEMRRRDVRYGVVSMCIGGGMGAAALFERP